MKTIKYLAEIEMKRSTSFEIIQRKETKHKNAIIKIYADALISYQGIKGVLLKRIPKPIHINTQEIEVKKMFVSSSIINDESHYFQNAIILN